jgi:predicted oxidoreductase
MKKKVQFGKKEVSSVVLGLMRTQNLSEKELEDVLDTAYGAGIDMLDCADIYVKGQSEELLGEVFLKRPDLRQKFFLQDKCGIVKESKDLVYYDFSKEHILSCVNQSLERLHTDHLDSLLLHRPDALMEPSEIQETFEQLHREGKVLSFGVSNFNPAMIEMLQKGVKFPLIADQIQLSLGHAGAFASGFEFNMDTEVSPTRDGGILEYCRANGIVIQAWSTLQYGFMEGSILDGKKFPKLNKVLERIGEEKGVSKATIALAWILRYPGPVQAITGSMNPVHILEAAKAMDTEISRREWYELLTASNGRVLP